MKTSALLVSAALASGVWTLQARTFELTAWRGETVAALVGEDGAYVLSTTNGKPVHDTKNYHEVNFN